MSLFKATAKLQEDPKWHDYLKERFNLSDEAYKQDRLMPIYAHIGMLLGNQTQSLRLLAQFEQKLVARFGPTWKQFQEVAGRMQQFGNGNPGPKAIQVGTGSDEEKMVAFAKQFQNLRDADSVHYYKFKKLLSGLLTDMESHESVGFSSTVPTLGGIFTGEAFAEVLAQGMHFKDPGVSPDHGDFTHRLQWWLVYTFIELPASQPQITWREVFSKLPTYKFQTKVERDMWSFLFDFLPSEMKVGGRDSPHFTQPENMNLTLMKTTAYPLLRALLIARYNKRKLMSLSLARTNVWKSSYPALKKAKNFRSYEYRDSEDEIHEIALAMVPPIKN